MSTTCMSRLSCCSIELTERKCSEQLNSTSLSQNSTPHSTSFIFRSRLFYSERGSARLHPSPSLMRRLANLSQFFIFPSFRSISIVSWPYLRERRRKRIRYPAFAKNAAGRKISSRKVFSSLFSYARRHVANGFEAQRGGEVQRAGPTRFG